FALRFVRGDFKRADPSRGRFRAFLKTALYHLVIDYQRRRRHLPLTPEAPEPAVEAASLHDADRDFLATWRAELLNRAWQDLAQELIDLGLLDYCRPALERRARGQ